MIVECETVLRACKVYFDLRRVTDNRLKSSLREVKSDTLKDNNFQRIIETITANDIRVYDLRDDAKSRIMSGSNFLDTSEACAPEEILVIPSSLYEEN